MSGVFCDKMNVSFNPDIQDSVIDSVRPILDGAGGQLEYSERGVNVYRFPTKGTIRMGKTFRVFTVQASGQALAALRAASLFGEYLRAISDQPHRVTLLHATLDIPEYSPPLLDRLYRAGKAGRVSLSRKSIAPCMVQYVKGPNPQGDDTGTVYLNNMKAEVYGKVYDKQQERLDNAGEHIPPTTRIELGITSKQGISLKDAWDPTSVFYKYASPGLVERPEGVPEFVPGGVGFELPKVVPLLPAQRLARRVENSADLTEILKLAEQVGPHGLDYFWRLVEKQYRAVNGAGLDMPTSVSG